MSRRVGYLSLFLLVAFSLEAVPKLSHEVLEMTEIPDEGLPVVVIRLIPEGFPEKTPLKVSMRRIDDSIVEIEEEYFIENREDKDFMKFGLHSLAKGDPILYTVKTADESVIGSEKIVPFPIEAKDSQGHFLSVEIGSNDAQVFIISVKGYQPFEKIDIITSSMDEVKNHQIQVSEKGSAQITEMPRIAGYKTGDASFVIKGEDSPPLKVTYLWGAVAKLPYKNKM